MPQPPFSSGMGGEERRARIMELSQRINELAARMTPADDDNPEIIAAITGMEQTLMAMRIQAFYRRRARERARRLRDDGVVNAQLPKEDDW